MSTHSIIDKKRVAKFSVAVLVSSYLGLAPVFVPMAMAAVVVTPATGGSAIDASTVGGAYTSLTGPVIVEGAVGDIGGPNKTIVLSIPSGFEFDTTASSVTATITNGTCSGGGNKTILLGTAAGSATQMVTPTTSTITIDVKSASTGAAGCKGTLTFSGIKVRPTAAFPLASGNITKSATSTSTIVGITDEATNLGTLTEVDESSSSSSSSSTPSSSSESSSSSSSSSSESSSSFSSSSSSSIPPSSSSSSSSSGPEGDISITKATTSEAVEVEDTVTYTITIANGDISNAPNVVIEDLIPAGMTFISAVDGGGTDNSEAECVHNEGVLTCSLSVDGMLQKNETVIVTVVLGVTTSSCALITNTATVSADISDINSADNTDSASVQANGVCSSSSSSSTSSSSSESSSSSSSSSSESSSSSSSSESSSSTSSSSESSSSSSSSESSSSTSSSSESSSSSSEIFLGVTLPETNGGNGAFRGNRTNTLKGAARFITGVFGSTSIAPGAFGGSEVPLSEQEIELICSMRKALPVNASSILTEWFAGYLAGVMNRDADQILEALKDPTICKAPEVQAKATEKLITFRVDAKGFPVSSNPVWNKCIAGTATLADLRSNTDKDEDGLARDCSDYHTAMSWYHPDLNMFFTFDRKKHMVTVPKEYVLQKVQAFTINQ